MTIHLAKVDFTRGELSPLLHGRQDTAHYGAALKTCLNWLPMKEGALRKRSGTSFMGEVKDSSKAVRLIPFVFSSTQAYVLEAGDNYFRVFNTYGQVVSGGSTPVEVATPWAEADLDGIDFAQSADKLYVTHAGKAPQEIIRKEDDVWEIGAYEPMDGPYLQGNTTATTLTISDRGDIVPFMTSATAPSGTVTQNSGTGWHAFDGNESTSWLIANPTPYWLAYELPGAGTKVCTGYTIRAGKAHAEFMPSAWRLEGWNGSSYIPLDVRTAETGWMIDETRHYAFVNKVAYRKYRLTITQLNSQDAGESGRIAEIRLKESGDTMTPVTITASSAAGINNDAGFKSTDAGRHIRMRGDDGFWRWAKIVTRISATQVTARLYGPVFQNTTPMVRWHLGAWGEETGWPAHVSFFSDRLTFARTNAQPQKIWGSKVGDYVDHGISSPLVDDDAIDLEILSGEINEIKWIEEGRTLMIGTAAATRTIRPLDTNKPVSATNVSQQRHTTFGSADVSPVKIGGLVIYAGPYGRTLREFLYSLDVDGYVTPELTILSGHLFTAGVKQMVYAQEPDPVIWIVCNDGSLVSLTYERDQKIVAIAKHELGGTDTFIESIVAIPGPTHDEVWLAVRRTVNGATRKYIERLNRPFLNENTEDGVFLDSAVTYSGAPAGTFTGLSHLEGETVSVLGDGMVFEDLAVSGGQITLPDGATVSKAHIGLPYTAACVTLPPAQGARDGAALGRTMRAVQVITDVYRSLGVKLGGSARQDEFLHREGGDLMDTQIPLKTGRYRVSLSQSREDGGEITILSDTPLPALIRGLNIQYEIEP